MGEPITSNEYISISAALSNEIMKSGLLSQNKRSWRFCTPNIVLVDSSLVEMNCGKAEILYPWFRPDTCVNSMRSSCLILPAHCDKMLFIWRCDTSTNRMQPRKVHTGN